MFLSTLMSLFGVFSNSGVTCGCASGVSALFSQFPFLTISLFLVELLNFFLVDFLICFSWVHLLKFLWVCLHNRQPWRFCSGEWLLWFIWILIRFYSWFTCWIFSWCNPLTGTIRGTAGEVDFPNISARDLNASLCEFPSVNIDLTGYGL